MKVRGFKTGFGRCATQHGCGTDGMALLMCTLFISLALILLATICTRVVAQAHAAERLGDIVQLDAVAQAAVSSSAARLRAGESGTLGFHGAPAFDEGGKLVAPDWNAPDLSGVAFPLVPGARYFCIAVPWGGDGRDNNGDAAVDDAAEAEICVVHAFAEYKQMHRRIEAVFRLNPPSSITQVSWRDISGAAGAAGS